MIREQFYFTYHLQVGREEFRRYPIQERKAMLMLFAEQKEQEKKAHDKAVREAKQKAKHK